MDGGDLRGGSHHCYGLFHVTGFQRDRGEMYLRNDAGLRCAIIFTHTSLSQPSPRSWAGSAASWFLVGLWWNAPRSTGSLTLYSILVDYIHLPAQPWGVGGKGGRERERSSGLLWRRRCLSSTSSGPSSLRPWPSFSLPEHGAGSPEGRGPTPELHWTQGRCNTARRWRLTEVASPTWSSSALGSLDPPSLTRLERWRLFLI